MKLERISDNQIRCTLNKKDLVDRELRISELAYGTDKAKELFHDMMQQASYELGFEAEDIPLMIEAIPVSQESLVLIITKVEDPDELDTRFSKFSSDDEVEGYEFEGDDVFQDDLMPAFSDGSDDPYGKEFIPLSEAIASENRLTKEQASTPEQTSPLQAFRIFSFRNLEEVIALAQEIRNIYHSSNSLYKDTETGRYYLIMSKDELSVEEFHKVCNVASEFGTLERSNYATLSYYDEHYTIVKQSDAIERLADL